MKRLRLEMTISFSFRQLKLARSSKKALRRWSNKKKLTRSLKVGLAFNERKKRKNLKAYKTSLISFSK